MSHMKRLAREVVYRKDTKCETRYENKCEKVPGVGAVCHNEPSTQCTQVDRTKTEHTQPKYIKLLTKFMIKH